MSRRGWAFIGAWTIGVIVFVGAMVGDQERRTPVAPMSPRPTPSWLVRPATPSVAWKLGPMERMPLRCLDGTVNAVWPVEGNPRTRVMYTWPTVVPTPERERPMELPVIGREMP